MEKILSIVSKIMVIAASAASIYETMERRREKQEAQSTAGNVSRRISRRQLALHAIFVVILQTDSTTSKGISTAAISV